MQLDDYQRKVALLVLDKGKSVHSVATEYGHGWTTVAKWVNVLSEERAAVEHYEKVIEHAMDVHPEVLSEKGPIEYAEELREHSRALYAEPDVSCSFVLDGGQPFDERIEEIRKQRDAIARLMEARQSQTNSIADEVVRLRDKFDAKIEALEQEVAMLKRLVSEMHEVNGVLINLIEMR